MHSTHEQEYLLQKAIDGEVMSPEELRQFGAAIVADPRLAEELVLMRRIAADAARLARRQPSTGFADRIMEHVALAPAPAPFVTPRIWGRRLAVIAAGGVAVLAIAVAWGAGTPLAAWLGAEWAGGILGAWGEIEAALSSVWATAIVGALVGPLTGYAVWLALGLPALAGALNLWSLRHANR